MPTGWTLAVWLATNASGPDVETQKRPLVDALEISAGPCLERARLAEVTAAWLTYAEIDARLDIDVEQRGDETVSFEVLNGGELTVERQMPAPKNCADRHAAVGFAIALAIDASVFDAVQLPAAPPPTVTAPPEDADAPTLRKRERVTAPPTPRTRVDLFAGAFAGFELLPGVAFGGRAGVRVGATPWMDVDIEGLAAGGLPFAIGAGEVQPTLAGGAIGVCPAKRWRRFAIRLCVAAAAGAVVATGRGFDEARTTTLPWVAGRALGDAGIKLGKLVWLGVSGGFVAPIVRTNFDLQNEGGITIERREVAAAAGIAGIDLAVTLPATLRPR